MLVIILYSNKYNNKDVKELLYKMINPSLDLMISIIPKYFDQYQKNIYFINVIINIYKYFSILNDIYSFSKLEKLDDEMIKLINKLMSIEYELSSIYIIIRS